jgi:hypothetical protein
VRLDANGPHARAAAAVRYAKGFMQIEVRHVGAVIGWPGQTHLGVHVCPIDVHLSAGFMNPIAKQADAFLEHAMG